VNVYQKGQVLGRPPKADDAILTEYPQVVEMLGQGIAIREVSRLAGVARNTVRKVKAAMDE
jgi:DNA invertase Pin-like site-specific DNA recombinase